MRLDLPPERVRRSRGLGLDRALSADDPTMLTGGTRKPRPRAVHDRAFKRGAFKR